MDKKLKFLMISDFKPDPDSGTPGTIFAIGKALKTAGHEVDFEWKAERSPWFSQPGLYRFLELPFIQLRQARARLRSKAYDVVIVSQIYGYRIYEKLGSQYPETIFLNLSHGWEDRVYHQSYLWEPPLTGFAVRRLSRYLTHKACVRTAKNCTAILASSAQAPEFISVTCSIPKEKIHAITYGLDPEFLSVNLSGRAVTEDLRLLYVGNYLPIKGSKVMERILPETAVKFPGVKMTFVVPPFQTESIRDYYAPFFGSRLRVLPWMKRGDLLRTYLEHDILLFPSLFEGFGKSFLEAMACGLCVVGYNEGGLPALADSGKEAYYCEGGDEAGLTKLLEYALKNPEETRAIGLRAYEKVKNFSWGRTVSEITDYCLTLKRERPKRV